MLPLTFANPADYDKVQPSDRVSLVGLSSLAPGKVTSLVNGFLVVIYWYIRTAFEVCSEASGWQERGNTVKTHHECYPDFMVPCW